jgi:hypothetical protein
LQSRQIDGRFAVQLFVEAHERRSSSEDRVLRGEHLEEVKAKRGAVVRPPGNTGSDDTDFLGARTPEAAASGFDQARDGKRGRRCGSNASLATGKE